MTNLSGTDADQFRRILARNVTLPLGAGLLSAVLFIALIAYLLNVVSWVEHTDRVMSGANETAKLSVDLETGIRGFLISGDEAFLTPYEVAQPRILAELDDLQLLTADNPEQISRLKRIAALQRQWNVYAAEIIQMRRAGGDYRTVVTSGRGKGLSDQMRREYTDFLSMEQSLRSARSQSARNTTIAIVAIYLLVSLLVSGLLAFFGRRELIQLSDAYATTLANQKAQAAKLLALTWLREGQSQLATRVIGQQTLSMLGSSVLEFLSGYVGNVAGAMYVRDLQGRLQRVASAGLEPGTATADSFLPTEGVVAQAATEKRVIELANLPAGYLRIASGLGDGAPHSALVVPLDDEGAVNGVIEIGFLSPLQPRDVELLKLLAPDIGASIEAARYRQRLQDVLHETQQLNEELQVQQEELRTANEELEEQSRVLKESQASLENQQAELEQTNEQLSQQAHLLDQRNGALNDAQQALQERAEELTRASRYKSEFLANMSHELRTPLNSSLILAKLLADNTRGNLDAEQVKFAESIYSAGNDLLHLINDILDISKVEAGRLDVHPQDTRIARLADALRMTFEPLAMQKQIELQVEIADGTPATLFTDGQRIEQILKNLLSNAVKFTEHGSVALRVSATPDGSIAFAVRDSGIGIRPEQHETVFEAFRQADGTTSRRYGGTGLGLSISRDLARLLGGTIGIESAPGEGSTFTLTLPQNYQEMVTAGNTTSASVASAVPYHQHALSAPSPRPATAAGLAPRPSAYQPPQEPEAPAAPAPHFDDDRHAPATGGRCVLVVEDEPQFAGILFDLAHELKYRCLVAHTTEEGFSLAIQHGPHAILLDMRLPDGSGLALLQRLKANARTRHIPVHVISVEDRMEAALHMGAIGYAVKPASRNQLKEVFDKLDAKLEQTLKRVLLVEDDDRQRESVVQLIGDDDVEITAVATGSEALALLAHNVYDCMIIDLKLPDMQGNELLRRMSADDICSFPPVIVYTGRNLTRDEEAELLKYSRSIIIKGARSPERLLDEVTLFLHRVESDLSTERQTMLRTARSRDRVFEGRRILVVDDDVRNIFALTSALEQKGAIVEVGRNGFEALDKLHSVADIDLVLMDVMMPGMDGLQATREIRKNGQWKGLPIIAVTAKAMKDDQDQCLQAGANDYLAKPIDLDRLFSLLRVWMPKVERI